jgi:hypothetical protein
LHARHVITPLSLTKKVLSVLSVGTPICLDERP